MALQRYELLPSIDTTTNDWQCRVRAQTVWKGINKETLECWGINIIFVTDSVRDSYLHLLKSITYSI